MVCIMLLSGGAFAGIEDKVIKFSASGIDRYADGSVVVDGECYALVWSPKGSVFAGFNADGTVVSPDDRLVLAAPLAKDGKCRDAIFQVPAAEYAELDGGEWAVCLVDTRMGDGVPAGVFDGRPLRVNRWGLASRLRRRLRCRRQRHRRRGLRRREGRAPARPASAPTRFPQSRRISSRLGSRLWKSPMERWFWRWRTPCRTFPIR